MLTTGQISFTNFANSIINDLARIAVRAAITGPIASGLSSLFSGWSFGGTDTSSAGVDLISSNTTYFNANGGVYSGGNISAYSGSVVTSPTLFNFGSRVSAFANGAGLMGEAGPEGILPLRPLSNGKLGVGAEGIGGSNVQVNIINASGEQVTQRTKTDNYGNKSIEVMIGDAAAAQALTPGSKMNRASRMQNGGRMPVTRR